eukprot:10180651-Karenia_brevis.AAC.1
MAARREATSQAGWTSPKFYMRMTPSCWEKIPNKSNKRYITLKTTPRKTVLLLTKTSAYIFASISSEDLSIRITPKCP